MQIIFEPTDVTIRDMPPVPVAMSEHRGDRKTIPDTRQRFMAWRGAAGLSPANSASYMVFRSEREPAIAADYAMDLCVETDQPIEANEQQVVAGIIPGGRCAVLRYPGNSNNLEPAAHYLYRDWLPASGQEARDFPIYCRRQLSLIPNVPAHEVVVELFLPLK